MRPKRNPVERTHPGSAASPLNPNRTPHQPGSRKPVERGRSGAVWPVKSGQMGTTTVKINNRCAQLIAYFHAQSRTCPASLPSWPCRFDPGHPLHRKTLKQEGFSPAHGRPVLLKRGPWVPSGAVYTTPVPRRRARDHPAHWPCRFDPGHLLHRKPLPCRGFRAPTAAACLLNVRSWVPCGTVAATPLRQAPVRQAGHAGSIPVTPSAGFFLRVRPPLFDPFA